ncbi:hypothetical protein BZZ01_04680 [Nostocales cyanobacterium HT-58-2]|nr:hypothetical protein BZZ01_04680 [Nostocales cyanobacterium HT-58-2]
MTTLQPSLARKEKFVINIVTLGSGGGHYASCNAICSIFEQSNTPYLIRVIDAGEIMNGLAKQKKIVDIYNLLGSRVEDVYAWLQKNNWTWLQLLKMRLDKLLAKLNYSVMVKVTEEYCREQHPDLVVSIVPCISKVLWEGVQRVKPGTPLVTIVTDFADCPPGLWIEPETGNYFVCGTEKAVEQARSLGVKEERIIKTSGMLIHPRFYEPIECDRRAERQKLGLDPDRLTGLVMFGGNGSKVMLEIAKRLECFREKLQLIFICGRNEELAKALRESQGIQKRFVITFTQDVPYYMHLSDFFIGKPGPGCISEALAMKLPVIVERNWLTLIQERYNTDWIQQKQVGLVIPSFHNVAQAVEQFFNPETFSHYRAKVAAINNRAVFEVTHILQQILANSYNTTVAELMEQR